MELVLRDISRRFGSRMALDSVDLTLGSGVWGLLGANGAGKSTLIRLVSTGLAPSSGSIALDGRDLLDRRHQRAIRRRIGYLPQHFGYFGGFSVDDFLRYCGLLKEMDPTRLTGEIGRVLAEVELTERRRSRLRELSGGMIRRVGIAQAILNDPDLVLLDEPTVGLDPRQRLEMREIVRRLGRDRIVLLSTHLAEDIAATSDHVVVLDAGSVRFQGTLGELTAGTPEGLAPTQAIEHQFDRLTDTREVA